MLMGNLLALDAGGSLLWHFAKVFVTSFQKQRVKVATIERRHSEPTQF